MRIHVATDHAGLEFSQKLQEYLKDQGHEVIDHGPQEFDALDDYPAFCINAAQAVAQDEANGTQSFGVVFGGSGNGEQMAANKVVGIRAALVWSEATASLAREHNNANVISIGARQHDEATMLRLVEVFLNTFYKKEERHERRIKQLREYEDTGQIVGKGVNTFNA